MTRISYVIDNDQHKLADVLNQLLEDHADLAMDVATAFFNVRGYGLLRHKLEDLGSLRLILGAEPQSGEDVGLKPRLAALQANLRGDLATEPYTPETLALVEDLIRFLPPCPRYGSPLRPLTFRLTHSALSPALAGSELYRRIRDASGPSRRSLSASHSAMPSTSLFAAPRQPRPLPPVPNCAPAADLAASSPSDV